MVNYVVVKYNGGTKYKVETETNTPENGDRIVNLTNQIEYVFEIKLKNMTQ